VFEAAHRNRTARIYWHLDRDYLGVTREVHTMGVAPAPGHHRLTLVDENGERIERAFAVISGEKPD
jgi:penicillin-binding protein 1C